MTQPLSVDPGAVRSLGEVHQRVAGELGALAAAAPGAGAVAQSHGTIAAAVDAALTGALGARSDTMATTRGAGDTISELLRQAALAYERGDDRGAEAIRIAADHLARSESDGVAGTSATATPPVAADALGQLSQLGQLGQQLVTPFAALAQPLAQLPQLLAQGLAQAGQGADRSEDPEIPDVSEVSEIPNDADPDAELDAAHPDAAHPDRDEERDPDDESPTDGAGPHTGDGGPPGTDPTPPPTAPRPAPTRPAVG
ncbi:type VII secretion target [Mycobacterium sp. ITM-2016-00317]|uniref:type VII secretion target n=1 Tax=Mycobacterium sp. ITM-2016-00317 TaxID=2099694 RepID=UPI000D460A55|nr:type VII secretion target [Mycobacterium sp. ITM-2016-00317]WNG86261.1 type VII secretion target [Mycobacterium sp. ITM-2016-00317]